MGDIIERNSPFTEEEQVIIRDYKSNGKPGIARIKDDDIAQLFDLYMSGKTYKEIAKLSSITLCIVLYLSEQFDWHGKKMTHFNDLIAGMTDKLTQIKLETTNTLNTTISAMNKYFGDSFNKYLQTGNKEVMEGVDTKLLVQYYKAVDTLSKLTAPVKIDSGSDSHPNPAVNINLNGNTTVQTPNNETIEITKENAGDVLKMMSAAKKEKENQ